MSEIDNQLKKDFVGKTISDVAKVEDYGGDPAFLFKFTDGTGIAIMEMQQGGWIAYGDMPPEEVAEVFGV